MFNDDSVVLLLNELSKQSNRYLSIFILLFGTIGNLLNCLVLSQPSLRTNPCAFLFLASSIANMISLIFGLSTRILAGWNLDLTSTNSILCKSRVYIMFVSRTIAFWLIALATIDRWCSSCIQHQRRRMSSLRNAHRGTFIIVILSSLFYCQVIYCYESNILQIPLACYGRNRFCRFLTDFTYAIITVLCPIMIMSILGILTIINIRQTYAIILSKSKLSKEYQRHRGTLSMTRTQRERWKKIDRYLRHVLFRQIILQMIFTLPQVIEKLYTTITIHQMKSPIQIAMDRFIYNCVLLLTYVASGMPFYIYTLSGGSIFRTTFVNLVRRCSNQFSCI